MPAFTPGMAGADRQARPIRCRVPQDVGLDPNALDLHSKGALGGLQAGYNWQFAPNWVAGIEADISWSGIRGRQTDAVFVFGGAGVCAWCSPVSFDRKWDYLGTFRGRLGYTQGHWLAYATGGFAFGSTTVDASLTANSFALAPPPRRRPSAGPLAAVRSMRWPATGP